MHSPHVTVWVKDKIFYPRVKSQISVSGVQEKIFNTRIKYQISLSGVQEMMQFKTVFYVELQSTLLLRVYTDKGTQFDNDSTRLFITTNPQVCTVHA